MGPTFAVGISPPCSKALDEPSALKRILGWKSSPYLQINTASKKQTLKTTNVSQLSSTPWLLYAVSNRSISADRACPLQGQGETDKHPGKPLKGQFWWPGSPRQHAGPEVPASQACRSPRLESGLPRAASSAPALPAPAAPPCPLSAVLNLRQSWGAWHFTNSLLRLQLQAPWGRGQALSSQWHPQLAAQCPSIYWRESKYFSNCDYCHSLGFTQQLTLQNPPTLNQWLWPFLLKTSLYRQTHWVKLAPSRTTPPHSQREQVPGFDLPLEFKYKWQTLATRNVANQVKKSYKLCCCLLES